MGALLGELVSLLKVSHADTEAERPRSLLFEKRRERTALAGFPESNRPLSAFDFMSSCGECGGLPLSERLES